jgi:hypothetical protein
MGKDDEIKGLGDGWRSFLSWIDMVEFTQNRYDRKWVGEGFGLSSPEGDRIQDGFQQDDHIKPE